MQKITTFLWYDNKAEEAAKLYVSLFKNSKIVDVSRTPGEAAEKTGLPAGSAFVVTFELDGQEYMALNGGPEFKFTEAMSLRVLCDSQEEVDQLWEKLGDGGEHSQCGWLKDRYGLWWQIIPKAFDEMMRDKNPRKISAVMAAMFKMQKFDIATLKRAYDAA
jgi:predicted 3-demethylubiquinone-9 3-methyltransferase (glyoxalase superfamily)